MKIMKTKREVVVSKQTVRKQYLPSRHYHFFSLPCKMRNILKKKNLLVKNFRCLLVKLEDGTFEIRYRPLEDMK